MTFDSVGTSPLVQPVQYVALSSGASLLGFEAETLWQQALSAATNHLAKLLTRKKRDKLLIDVFGRAGTDKAVFRTNQQALLAAMGGEGLKINVELRSDGELNGALAAYAAVGHTGSERIYVNADKITSGVFDLQLLTAALLEEFGAAMDRRLNGGADSPGDEGQLFAAQLTGVVLSAAERALIDAEDDTAVLTIEGVQVLVEEATISGTGIQVGTDTADNITGTGTTGVDYLFGGDGDDIIDTGTGSGRDIVIGGRGADSINSNSDAAGSKYIIYAGDSSPVVGGSGTAGTISGFDIIYNHTDEAQNDLFRITGQNGVAPSSVINTALTAPSPSFSTSRLATGTGRYITGVATPSNGLISFRDGTSSSGTSTLAINTKEKLAAAVQYLMLCDLGNAGATVIFTGTMTDANELRSGAAASTSYSFVYTQATNSPGGSLSTLIAIEIESGADVLTRIDTGTGGQNNRLNLLTTSALTAPSSLTIAGSGTRNATTATSEGFVSAAGVANTNYVDFIFAGTAGTVYKSVQASGTTVNSPQLTAADLSTIGDGTVTVTSRRVSTGGVTSGESSTTFTLDTTRPTVAIASTTSTLKAAETATITFTLSEASTNFVVSDITVSGGTLSGFSGSGTSYTATFTPTANSTTNGVISVASGTFSDAAGNTNNDGADANNSVTLTVDTIRPTVAISSNVSTLKAGETATITFSLSEASTNFAVGDITVSGGTVSGFSGSGTSYTATFTPTANSTTNGVISVASGTFSDAAGNTNNDGADANNSVTLTVDTAAPTLTAGAQSAQLVEAGSAGAGTDSASRTLTLSGGTYSTDYLTANGWTAVTPSPVTTANANGSGYHYEIKSGQVGSQSFTLTGSGTYAPSALLLAIARETAETEASTLPIKVEIATAASGGTVLFEWSGTGATFPVNASKDALDTRTSVTLTRLNNATLTFGTQYFIRVSSTGIFGKVYWSGSSSDLTGLPAGHAFENGNSISDKDLEYQLTYASDPTSYTKTGTYGAATLNTSTGVVSYTLDNNDADTNALAASASASDSFTIRAVDPAGNNTDTPVSFAITGSNDAPDLTAVSSGSLTDTSANDSFNAITGTLAGSDVDAGSTLTYGITGGTVSAGTSTLAGTYGFLSVNTSTGAYTYTPNASAINALSANATDTFIFSVSDGSLSTTTGFTVNIIGVNDTPIITSATTASFAENGTGTAYTATASDVDAGTTLTYSIAGTDAALFNINSSTGAVTFKNSPNFESPADAGANNVYDITVSASDGSLSSAAQAVAITVTNVVESTPVLTSVTINLTEGETKTLAASNFVASDLEGTTNFTFTVSSVAAGIFQLTSNPGQAITSFTTSQLNAGVVQFAQDGGEAPPSYLVTASNGSSTSNIRPVVAVMSNVNDAPVLVAASLTVAEGQTVAISSANFNVTDSDNVTFTYTVSGVSNGRFQLSSNPGQAISSFSTAQLNAGLVQFVHNGGEAAPAYSVQVSDGSLNSNTAAAAISFTNVNDAAVVTAGNSIGYTENGSPAVIDGSITVSDADSANLSGATVAISAGRTAGDLLGFTPQNGISGSYDTATGVLTLSGSSSVANYQAALRSITYSSSSDTPTAIANSRTISWQVNDGATANNVSAIATSTIVITPLNDAPGAASSTITIAEDGSYTFTAANFGFSDLDGNSLSSVIITSLPVAGSLRLNGVAVTANQVIAAASIGGLVFSPAANANGAGYASIGFRLQDNGGTANGGSDTSAAAAISFNVTPVNDAPVITSNGGGASAALSVAENTTAVTTVTASDIDSTGLTYSISGGADQAKFSINASSGVLSFVVAPDYENPSDAGADNTYDVIVNVSDGSLSASQAIAVAVTNLIDTPNEVPTLTINTPISGGYLNAAEQLVPLVLSGTITGLTNGAGVTVSVGGVAFSATVTSTTWSLSVPAADLQALSQGSISVTANGSDAAGNSASASASFIKDTINPTITINGPVGGDGFLNASEVNSSLTISGSSSGIETGRTITLVVGGFTYTATVQANGSWSKTLSSSQLQNFGEGTIPITANGSDAAGNAAPEASTSVEKDTLTPTISLNQPISAGYLNASELAVPLSLGGSVTDANGQTVTVTLVAGGATLATLTTIASAGAWSLNVPTGTLSALPQGTITVNAAVSNAAGTAASPATASFIKDTVAPTITITTPIGGDGYVNKNETNAALAISGTTSGASNGRPVAVVVGGVSYATTVNNNAWSVSVSSTALKALSDGTIGVTASVSDEAGNTGSQASSFILDTVAPTTAPTVNPSTTAPSSLAVLSGTATVPEGGCLVVTVNGANYSPVAVTDGTWTLNLASATPSSGSLGSFLDGSSYTVTATVCDAAGNGTSGTGTLAVSTPTPNTPTVNPLTTGLANGKPSSPITGGVQLRSGEKLTVSVSDGTTTAIYDNVMPTSGSNWSINLSAIPTSGTLPTFVLGSSYNIIATVTSANGSLTATDTSSAELTIGAPAILGTLSAALTTNGAEDNGADGTISATPTVFTFTRTPATGVLAANLPELIASYTLGGTSLGGVDYAYPAGYNPITGKGTVTFAAGATTATLTLNTINNSIVNGSRSLNAYLVKPSDYTLATIYSAGALLVDNDGAAAPVSLPVVSINSTSLVEGIAGTTSTATLKLTLSQTYSQDVSVNWTTKSSPGGSLPNATATAGTDYVAASGTAVILANSTGANVNITINGDGTLEASENFYVQLTEATNATLSPTNATGTITILNNDASGQLIDNSASTTNSTITGTTFADTLIGGSGNNNISGGAGNDLLRGGMGADTLTGGTGSDTFEYTSFAQSTRGSATQDYIVSFDLGSDRIKLPSLPGSLFNAGAITATNLDAAITSVYADKNRALAGNQAMASGDAVLFSYKATGAVLATTYLMVAAGNSANSSSDLFLRMGTGLSGVAVGQVSTPFFTT
jgi:VCBS repeat-containing protein